MNRIWKLMLVMLLVGGLVASVMLVLRNQETRRGAAADTANPFFNTVGQAAPNEEVTVIFGVDTNGKGKLSGAEVAIDFDRTKLDFVGVKALCETADGNVCYAAASGTTILFKNNLGRNILKLQDSGVGGTGILFMGVVSPSTNQTGQQFAEALPEGSVNLLRMVFKVKAGASGTAVFRVVPGEDQVTLTQNGSTVAKAIDTAVTGQLTIGANQQQCSRCSTVFRYQRVGGWSAVDCTANPPVGATVTRTYDANCKSVDVPLNCQRCSITNNEEYVWWIAEAGVGCTLSPDATKVDIFRASNVGCTVPATAPTATPTSGANECTDSDGGKTYGQAGNTCVGTDCLTDSCNTVGLIEYFCQAGARASEVVACGDGKHCAAGVCVTTVVPTATPTAEPTATPTEPSGRGSYLNIKMSFSGLVASGQCKGDLALQLLVLGDGTTAMFNVTPVEDTTMTDKLVYVVKRELNGFVKTNNVAVFLKGPKHLQMKYGVGGQTDFYNKASGELTLTDSESTSTVYDFTEYPLLAGDVNVDGIINGIDFSLLKVDNLALKKVDAGSVLATDLDGDCVVTSRDMNLLRVSLNEKYSQMY